MGKSKFNWITSLLHGNGIESPEMLWQLKILVIRIFICEDNFFYYLFLIGYKPIINTVCVWKGDEGKLVNAGFERLWIRSGNKNISVQPTREPRCAEFEGSDKFNGPGAFEDRQYKDYNCISSLFS